MNAVAHDPKSEFQIIKQKYNALASYCKNLLNEIQMFQQSELLLQKKLEDTYRISIKAVKKGELLELELSHCKDLLAVQPKSKISDDLHKFFMDFHVIINDLKKNDFFIPYAYAPKNSNDYLRVEKKSFDDCICKFTDFQPKDFCNICIKLMLIKSEDGKYVFNSDKRQIYYINKHATALILDETAG